MKHHSNLFTCIPSDEYGPRSAFPVEGKVHEIRLRF